MLEGYAKADPPTRKMLPVEADVPKLLVDLGYGKDGTIQTQAIGDLSLIAFYYHLLRQHNKQHKQTIQFKLNDVKLFKKNKWGTLVCLPDNAPAALILSADSATLKLDNKKNGWKGVCVHQEANGE